LGSFGQTGGRCSGLGFVLAILLAGAEAARVRSARIGLGGTGGFATCPYFGGRERRVEPADCKLAARERTPLVAVERRCPQDRGAIGYPGGEKIPACAPGAQNVELRRRDEARHREAFTPGIGPCDGARQGGKLLRQLRHKHSRAAQAVPARIARRARLTLRRLGAAAGTPIGTARLASCLGDHGGLQIQNEVVYVLDLSKPTQANWQANCFPLRANARRLQFRRRPLKAVEDGRRDEGRNRPPRHHRPQAAGDVQGRQPVS
jgi:hypothetical protein